MATEEYGLIVKVDATSANKASRDLDQFTAAATRADAANAKLSTGSKTSAASLTQHAQESTRAERAVAQLAETEQQAQQRIHSMVQASTAAQRATMERVQAERQASDAAASMSQAEAAAMAQRKASTAALVAAQNAQMTSATEMAGAQAKLDAIMGASKMTTAEVIAAEDALDDIRRRGLASIAATDQAAARLAEIKVVDTAVTKANAKANLENAAAIKLNGRASRELGTITSEVVVGNFGRVRRSTGALANQLGLFTKLLTPIGATIGITSAGILAYVKAAYSAEAATGELNKAILATGGAAGVTTGQLSAMTVALTDGKRSAADIHDALIAVVSSGQFAGDQIQKVAAAALDMANVTGQSVRQAVAQFAKIGQDPVNAAIKLNDSYHFLTQSVYDQISALQEQGDTEDATRVAVDALAKSMDAASKNAEQHIGTLHAMWNELKRDLSLPAALLTAAANHSAPDEAGRNAVAKQMLEMYKQQGYFTENATGDFTSTDKFSRLRPEFQETMLFYVTMYNKTKVAADAAADAAQGLADQQKDLQGVMDDDAWVKRAIKGFDTVKERAQAAADVSQKLFNLLLHGRALPEGVKVAPGTKGGFTGPGFEYLVNQEMGAGAAKTSTRGTPSSSNLDRLLRLGTADFVSEVAAVGKAKDANEAYNDQLGTQIALRKNAIDLQVESVGMGQKEIQRQQELNRVYLDFNRQMASLNKERDRGAINASEYQRRSAELAAAESSTIEAMVDGYKRLDAAQMEWRNGFVSGVQDIIDQGANVAGMMHDTVTDAFGGMTDAVVNFVQIGKFSLKGLADSFISDIVRMEAQALESQVWSMILGMVATGPAGYNMGYLGMYSQAATNATARNVIGNVMGGYADGGVFDSRGLVKFAQGGIVSSPTLFKFASGTGLMGEAGPEAIVPLTRGSDGKLGVNAQGLGGDKVNLTVVLRNEGGDQMKAKQAGVQRRGNNIMAEFVLQTVAGDTGRGGITAKAMEQRYGLQRRGVPVGA